MKRFVWASEIEESAEGERAVSSFASPFARWPGTQASKHVCLGTYVVSTN
jgi:hypothetical protein